MFYIGRVRLQYAIGVSFYLFSYVGSASSIHKVGILPTLAYRSPEMLLWRENSSPQVWTEKVDIWSWG